MCIFGMVLALPGTLFGIPAWTSSVGCDVADQANLLLIFFTGQLTCTAAAGIAVDRVGAQRVLMTGAALLTVGFLLLSRAGSPVPAGVAIALLAAGGSAVNAASNTLVSVTFGPRRGAMLSLMGLACAAGAFAAPFVLASPEASAVALRLNVLAVAGLALTLVPMTVAQAPWDAVGITLSAMLALARDRRLGGLIVWLGLEFGLEAVLAGWSAAYALAVMPGGAGALMVAYYWGGLAIGRACTPLILGRFRKLTTVAGATFVASIGVAVMLLAPTPLALATGVTLAGLAVGPLAPTIIAVAGDRYPKQSGLAIGLLLSVAQVGGMVLPWLTGRTAIMMGFRTAMVVPLAAAMALSASASVWRILRPARAMARSRSETA